MGLLSAVCDRGMLVHNITTNYENILIPYIMLLHKRMCHACMHTYTSLIFFSISAIGQLL